jgi:hypothetical protein
MLMTWPAPSQYIYNETVSDIKSRKMKINSRNGGNSSLTAIFLPATGGELAKAVHKQDVLFFNHDYEVVRRQRLEPWKRQTKEVNRNPKSLGAGKGSKGREMCH